MFAINEIVCMVKCAPQSQWYIIILLTLNVLGWGYFCVLQFKNNFIGASRIY